MATLIPASIFANAFIVLAAAGGRLVEN